MDTASQSAKGWADLIGDDVTVGKVGAARLERSTWSPASYSNPEACPAPPSYTGPKPRAPLGHPIFCAIVRRLFRQRHRGRMRGACRWWKKL